MRIWGWTDDMSDIEGAPFGTPVYRDANGKWHVCTPIDRYGPFIGLLGRPVSGDPADAECPPHPTIAPKSDT